MSKTLLEYGRENSDLRLWLVIPQKELEKNPQLMGLPEITPEVIQKIQELAEVEKSSEKELLANKALFGTPENPIILVEMERETEAEPMEESELEAALREMAEEGMAMLSPQWFPRGKAEWDESQVDSPGLPSTRL